MREKRSPKPKKKLGYRVFYWFAVAVIVGLWVYSFKSYFDHYDSLHPEIAWALPWVQADSIMSQGVFLWNEAVLKSPRAGKLSFPSGEGPVRVAKGAVVARVAAGSSFWDVRAPQEGYFLAGLDGFEGKWRYASLWPGEEQLPEAPQVKMMKKGQGVKDGAPVGKLVYQPQDLRFIGYVDMTGNLENELASNGVMVKMDPLDTPSHAPVRVYEKIGHKAKIYLSIPWFPPETVLSRNYELIIEAGSVTGVAIPESAVAVKDGARGAFVLKGTSAVFTKIDGLFIGGARFLVTRGLQLGDAVIVDGQSAHEGKVKLW
jgi:hypothetical protein